MARDAQTIEADIERARDGLALAVDELSTRLDPRLAIDKGKSKAAEVWGNPKVKAVVVGVGALMAYMMVRKIFR